MTAARKTMFVPGGPDECWEWTGHRGQDGYGKRWVGRVDGKHQYRAAHRLVYEELVGPIPAGCDLHHTCENKGCVNPAHLRPVTDSEHRLLHSDVRSTCRSGRHPADGSGTCHECRKESFRRHNQKRLPRTTGPTEACPDCGRPVALGYLSRHQRGCPAP